MKRSIIATLMLGCMTTSGINAQSFVTDNDILYSKSKNDYAKERCRIDVYHPTDTAGLPVIVWFHGGGLTGGNKSIPDELKDGKYVVMAANYRLLPKADITDCIDDAAAAVAWAFDNASNYGGDRGKIFVAGHSAGGYLTSMIGLDRQWLKKYGIEADSIAGLIPFSGQVITHFALRKQKGMSELQPAVDSLAPLYHVRGDSAPYIIITGGREDELLGRYEENAYMWRMMKMNGHKNVHIYELDGHNHGEMVTPAFLIMKKHIHSILNNR